MYSTPQKEINHNNNHNLDTFNINNDSKILSHLETEIGFDNIISNESISNIIDIISNNNLNLFYQDDSTNFKRSIDNLNLKFYLETEKMLASSNYKENNLFLILFKQITLYIKEIERLNLIILGMKKDEQSQDKIKSFMGKRIIDFETKEQIIKALQISNNSLEKKLTNLMLSENNLKLENMRLIKENMLYKSNNNFNLNNNTKSSNALNNNERKKLYYIKDKKRNKNDLFINNKIYIKNNYYNKINNDINANNNFNNTNIYNNNDNKIISKISKENITVTNNQNNETESKNRIISVKRDEHLLFKRHRRNYSDQIGVGVLIQDNVKNITNNINESKKNIKNNNPIKKNNNKINVAISSIPTPTSNGTATHTLVPMAAVPTQIKNSHSSKVNLKDNSKCKNSKSIKNKNKNTFTKKKTDNITNKKSKQLDFLSNHDKECSITKHSSSIFNKSNIYANGNISINFTENNFDFFIENEIEDLNTMEKILNQVKDYINNNKKPKNSENTRSAPNIIKININNNNNSNSNYKKNIVN